MGFKIKTKSGTITIEFAISLVSVVALLFIVLGVFNDNMEKIITNSNFKKIINEDGTRTDYQSYGRDYSDFTIQLKPFGSNL